MKRKMIELNGLKIACVESAGTGPTVLLVHGNSASGAVFLPVLEGELGRKHRMVALDLPGHGDSSRIDVSPAGNGSYSPRAFAGILKEFARALDIEQGVFVGHSMGGHLILEAAPLLVSAAGFAIFGTPPLSRPAPFEKAFLPHPAAMCFFKPDLTEAEINDWAATVEKDEAARELFRQAIRKADPMMRAGLGQAIMTLDHEDETAIAGGLRAPLAIFHGVDEPFINLEYIRSLKIPTLWKNQVQLIEGAGHFPHLEAPSRFEKLLGDFLSDMFRTE